MNNAQLKFLHNKHENLDKTSSDSWAAVGEYLAWRKPVLPTMLVQDGKVLTKGQELAEEMLLQKEEQVITALGEANRDYHRAGIKMTKGNRGGSSFPR